MSDKNLLAIAREIVSITKNSETKFIINDRIDLVLLSDADGVHLGQDDLNIESARKLLPKDKIIGLSTHNLKQAEIALLSNPDYIGFGPVYKTPTKKIPDPVLGTTQIAELLKLQTKMNNHIPFVAIGGIDENNIQEVLNSGAKNLSLVRYLMESENLESRINQIKSLITASVQQSS